MKYCELLLQVQFESLSFRQQFSVKLLIFIVKSNAVFVLDTSMERIYSKVSLVLLNYLIQITENNKGRPELVINQQAFMLNYN